MFVHRFLSFSPEAQNKTIETKYNSKAHLSHCVLFFPFFLYCESILASVEPTVYVRYGPRAGVEGRQRKSSSTPFKLRKTIKSVILSSRSVFGFCACKQLNNKLNVDEYIVHST